MIFTTPLGLLALLAIPAIVAIHLFRRRFPVRPVAGLFLWQIVRQTPEGGGRIARLPITASLILECLAALALALILAGARLSSAAVSQHLVVLLDDSASMAAVNARGESARDRAVRRVLGETRSPRRRRRGSRSSPSGERPSVLLGPAALAVEARPRWTRWKPEAPHHSLALGLRLARELAGRTGRLMVVSDLDAGAARRARSSKACSGCRSANRWPTSASPRARTIAVRDRGTRRGLADARQLLGRAGAPAARGRRRAARTIVDARSRRAAGNLFADAADSRRDCRRSGWRCRTIALLRDNEVMLAEPRPRIVGVENHLPEGRGRTALVKALESRCRRDAGRVRAPRVRRRRGHSISTARPACGASGSGGRRRHGWRAASRGTSSARSCSRSAIRCCSGSTLGGVVWTGAAPLSPDAVRPLVSAGDRSLIGIASAHRRGRPIPRSSSISISIAPISFDRPTGRS